ncbi:hypothetical protein [Massilia sp. erpn]|uniref:hypothetical protein n=1 Tax=Massilia sp. erpn TaxID=2738142 RepID=UPI002106D981|nr:hypothetical protein [Massilia sp. erpn]UTY55887.1 hypothetical protein HPQ68_01000 [Massilia sp. erpn]
MSASEVGFLAQVFQFDEPGDDEAPVPLDLADVSEENRAVLNTCVAEYRSAGRRVVSELLTMTEQLVKMREILGDRHFYPFVRNELGLKKRTITRYLHLNKVLQQHFAVEGKVPLAVTNSISQRALLLLSPETDAAVIQEVKAVIDDGGKIDSRAVEQILAEREAAHAAQLAGAQAEAQSAARALERQRDQHVLELARAQRELGSQTELLRRAEETSQILEQENDTLRRQATEVRYEEKKVEVIPAGFTSLQEAIDAKRGEINALASEQDGIAGNIAALKEKRRVLEQQLAPLSDGVDDFLALKGQIEALITRFPLGLLKELGVGDKTVKLALAGLGQTMKLFGEQLSAAGA